MDAREWAENIDPLAMFHYCVGNPNAHNIEDTSVHYYLGDRVLRLYMSACLLQIPSPTPVEAVHEIVHLSQVYADKDDVRDQLVTKLREFDASSSLWFLRPGYLVDCIFAMLGRYKSYISELPQHSIPAMMAQQLRAFAGNPFHAFAWSRIHDASPSGHNLQFLSASLLTPDVLFISRAAYSDRSLKSRCELDLWQLSILADALEDAGLPGTLPCPVCHGKGTLDIGRGVNSQPALDDCWRCGSSGKIAHPIVEDLREQTPRYPGFWALDLILQKDALNE